MINPRQKRTLMLAIKAGEIMMKAGAEIHRVEDTITRICYACGMPYVEVFAAPTGIFVSIDPGDEDSDVLTYLIRLRGGRTDLKKLSDINSFSREFTTTNLSIEDSMKKLEEIDKQKPYPTLVRFLGASLVTSFFCAIFGGGFLESIFALIIGIIVYSVSMVLSRYDINYFIRGLACCSLASTLALVAEEIGVASNSGAITIGAIMLFVPGTAITNSIRDFLTSDMLAGIARMTEAFVVAISLATGAGIILKLRSIIGSYEITAAAHSPSLILAISLGFASTAGFCLLFHVPKRSILVASLIGGLGWGTYQLADSFDVGPVVACFLGAVCVGFLSDFSARILKEASTVFVIPGIMPLVPGAGMYYTMTALVSQDYQLATITGSNTLFAAGSIALGLLVVGSIIKIVIAVKRKIFIPK